MNSLKILENLEDLHFNNYVNQKDTLCWELPTFKNLKKLSLTTHYPFMKDNKPNETKKVINIDKSNKLEDINLGIGVTYNYDDTRWNSVAQETPTIVLIVRTICRHVARHEVNHTFTENTSATYEGFQHRASRLPAIL